MEGRICDGGAGNVPLIPGDIIRYDGVHYLVIEVVGKYIHCVDRYNSTAVIHISNVIHSGHHDRRYQQIIKKLATLDDTSEVDTGWQE